MIGAYELIVNQGLRNVQTCETSVNGFRNVVKHYRSEVLNVPICSPTMSLMKRTVGSRLK